MENASAECSEVARSEQQIAGRSEARPPLRVLVAEDDDAARIALAYILRSVGFEVRQAKNGIEALAEAAGGQDVILLDIQMPMLDGIRTLEGLRRNPETANAAVIILTSHASRDCVLKCAQIGADGFVVKQTMQLDVLMDKIYTAIEARQARVAAAAHQE